jgi:MerR family transcriptional regulator, copper efflux regulator
MRISEAARRLGTSPRMLRYREDLGLLPRLRDPLSGPSRGRSGAAARQFGPAARLGAVAQRGEPARQFGPVAQRGEPAQLGAVAQRGEPTRQFGPAARQFGPAHRQFDEADLEAVAAALELERRYDISPASLAFGLRVIAEPSVRAAVADLGRRLGRVPPAPGRALDFEKERALRALSRS